MNGKTILVVCLVVLGVGGAWMIYKKNAPHRLQPKQLVFVGDTQDRVAQLLGEPSIEFPGNGTMIRWYENYEVTTSNDVVIAVEMKAVESEEERLEREKSVQLAEERLSDAYQVVLAKEQISYDVWLAREEERLRQERLELAKIQAYEERKSEEKKAAIRAEALRRSRLRYHHY